MKTKEEGMKSNAEERLALGRSELDSSEEEEDIFGTTMFALHLLY